MDAMMHGWMDERRQECWTNADDDAWDRNVDSMDGAARYRHGPEFSGTGGMRCNMVRADPAAGIRCEMCLFLGGT